MNQRRYRARVREKEWLNEQRVSQLTSLTYHYSMLRGLLVQPQLPPAIRQVGLRGFILKLYGELFRWGMEPESGCRTLRQQQVKFLKTHFHPDVVIESKSYAKGVDFWAAQLDFFTKMHRPRALGDVQVDKVDAEGEIFRAYGQTQLTVTREAIEAFYPYMLMNQDFLAQVVDQTIVLNSKHTFYFDQQNRIRYFVYELDFVQGWAQLIKDPLELVNVVQFRNMDNVYASKETIDEWAHREALYART